MATAQPAPRSAAETDAPLRHAREFVPSIHGFRFRNDFRGSPLPKRLREARSGLLGAARRALENTDALPTEFGLCGGMSAAAADYFLARMEISGARTPPEEGDTLREYLFERQEESLGALAAQALKFARLVNTPDESTPERPESCAAETGRAVPLLRARLEAGHLTPVGLVFVDAQKDKDARLWENHQVLAFDAIDRADGGLDIRIYEPNAPGDDNAVVRLTPVAKPSDWPRDVPFPEQYRAERRTGNGRVTKVRAMFCMPYARRTPPPDEPKPKGAPQSPAAPAAPNP